MHGYDYLIYIAVLGAVGAAFGAYFLYRERHPRKPSSR